MTVADLYNRLDDLIATFAAPAADQTAHCLDYLHAQGGVVYHGSVSNLDGVLRSTWTYEEGGSVVTRDFPIDQTTFDRLWVGVQRLPVFNRSVCNEMGQTIDPFANHVLSYIYSEAAGFGRCVFLLPAAETDRAFRVWLGLLGGPPQRHAEPRAAADRGLTSE